MISFDTNIIFAALSLHSDGHDASRNMLQQHSDDDQVVICELVLAELYELLRNPVVCSRPLSAAAAADLIQSLRHHPTWRKVDYAPEIADELWTLVANPAFPYRRIYDARLALTLRHHGVTEFATRNVKDFQDFGFKRVWNPTSGEHA